MPFNYNTQGITNPDANDPRNLGGSEGYGNPTASGSSGIMSSTANTTSNDDDDKPSFFESIANLFSGAGADLPSDNNDDGDSGASFYSGPMFGPFNNGSDDSGSDNNSSSTSPTNKPLPTSAADRAVYEALGIDVPEVYRGELGECEPEPNINVDVLQKALQPDPITVEEIEVKAGDTLSDIAKDKGVPVQDVINANPQIKNPDLIRPGEKVTVPDVYSGESTMERMARESAELAASKRDAAGITRSLTPEEVKKRNAALKAASEDPDRKFYQSTIPIEDRTFPAEAEQADGIMSKTYDSKTMEDINNPLGRRNTIVSGFDKNITSNGSFSNTEMTKAIKNTTDSNLFNAVVIGNIAKETGGDGPIDELGYGRLTGAEAAKDSRTRGGTDAESIARRVAYRALDSNPDFVNGDRATKDKMIFDIFYDDQYRPAGLKLGNTQPEDGSKFKGRGLIQVTGRENYQKVQDKLEAAGINVDLITNPELINDDKYALPAALAFLEVKGITKDNADQLGPYKVSRLINAGEGDTEATSRWSQITRVLTGGDLSSANSSDEKAAQTKAGITGTYSNGRSKVDGNIGPASEAAFRRYLAGEGVTIPDNATPYDLVRLVNTN